MDVFSQMPARVPRSILSGLGVVMAFAVGVSTLQVSPGEAARGNYQIRSQQTKAAPPPQTVKRICHPTKTHKCPAAKR